MKRLLASIDRPEPAMPRLRNYLLALALACLAGVLSEMLFEAGLPTPFIFGLGAVLISAWIGGLGPALVASLLMIIFAKLIAPDLPSTSWASLIALTQLMSTLSLWLRAKSNGLAFLREPLVVLAG